MTMSSLSRRALFGAALALVATPAHALPTVEVEGTRIHLGDLVPKLPDELAQIDVGRTPPPGGSRVIQRRDLEQALEREGVAGVGSLPKSVRVVRKMTKLSGSALTELAQEAMKGQPRKGVVNASFSPPAQVRVAAGYDRVELSLPKPPRRDGEWSTTAMLRFAEGDRTLTRVAIRCQLTLSKAAAAPDIAKGDPLTLVVRSGMVEVRVKGYAAIDADVGDDLPITLRPSGRTVRAKLVAPNRAITEGGA